MTNSSETTWILAQTYETVYIPARLHGLSQAAFGDLPWITSSVGRVSHWTPEGAMVDIFGFSGDLRINGDLGIRARESFPGTVATCLAITSARARVAQQPSGEGPGIPPSVQVAKYFAEDCAEYLSGTQPSKAYLSRTVVTNHPRGRLDLLETLKRRTIYGDQSRVVTSVRILSGDTPVNRYLLGANVLAASLLEVREPGASTLAHENARVLGLARLTTQPRRPALVDTDPKLRALVDLAADIYEGVAVSAKTIGDTRGASAWVKVDSLFERAIRQVLEEALPGKVDQGSASGTNIFDNSALQPSRYTKRADPDYVIRTQGLVVVADAKYRRSGTEPTEEQLYQLISHSQAFDATSAVILAPHSGPRPISRFGKLKSGCEVSVVAVDISNRSAFIASLVEWIETDLKPA